MTGWWCDSKAGSAKQPTTSLRLMIDGESGQRHGRSGCEVDATRPSIPSRATTRRCWARSSRYGVTMLIVRESAPMKPLTYVPLYWRTRVRPAWRIAHCRVEYTGQETHARALTGLMGRSGMEKRQMNCRAHAPAGSFGAVHCAACARLSCGYSRRASVSLKMKRRGHPGRHRFRRHCFRNKLAEQKSRTTQLRNNEIPGTDFGKVGLRHNGCRRPPPHRAASTQALRWGRITSRCRSPPHGRCGITDSRPGAARPATRGSGPGVRPQGSEGQIKSETEIY